MMPHGVYPRPPVETRFWAKVRKTDTCWIWTGKAHASGYSRIATPQGVMYAHRFSYLLHVSPIPEGLVLDHLCRTPLCVRPDHLEVVTVRENTLRGVGCFAENARKTHCPAGHLLEGMNLYVVVCKDGRTHRRCRPCNTARAREYRQRKAQDQGR